MSDEDIRRKNAADDDRPHGDAAPQDAGRDKPGARVEAIESAEDGTSQSQPDNLVSALRDIPRLRSIEEEAPGKVKDMRPPPPFVSRISGFTQGCGGLLLMLVSLVMLLSAFTYGFYLWGPGLLLAGGIVLVVGTVGVWRGQRVPVVVSLVALAAAVAIGYYWEAFISIAGRLTPLGGIGVLLGPAASLIALVLIAALASNAISLVYWRRLFPSTARGLTIWVGGSLALVLVVIVLHVTQQQQREAWMNDQLDAWRAEASGDALHMGTSMNVTLGYTFTTLEEGDLDYLDVHLADLAAAMEADSAVVRVGASGDMLLEAGAPVLFDVDEEDPESVQEAEDRIERQLLAEQAFMDAVQDSGLDLVIADYQYSPYLIVRASEDDGEATTWIDFVELQEERIRYYAGLYQPEYYEILNEPSQYKEYSSIQDPEGGNVLDAWIAQIRRLTTAVQEESPDTQIGVTIALQQQLDEDIYVQLLEMDDIDFIGFRMFQPAAFEVLEDMFAELGHPADHGKEVWIVETWYGACLAPQRSQELDAKWLELAAVFASKERMSGVLASDFGCFVSEGGTRISDDPDLDSRTDVWRDWADLIAVWQG